MAHETLEALYEKDVEAFGIEKANSFWEYNTIFGWVGFAYRTGWFSDIEYRRKPDAPWPWEERIKQLEVQLASEGEWPDDAPAWANAAILQFLKEAPFSCEVQEGHRLIKRPQPSKRKIDWSQLAPWVMEYWKPTFGRKLNESGWIPWNVPGCRDDMEGRGCPVPDGVVVEIISANGVSISGNSEEFDWSDFSDTKRPIVAFSITGIADGWE